METRKIAKEYRLTHWMQVLQECKASGQNITEFCQSREISKNQYFYWQRKLREEACAKLAIQEGTSNLAPVGWMQLGQEKEMTSTLDIKISGCYITVNPKTDSELLQKVCRALRTL